MSVAGMLPAGFREARRADPRLPAYLVAGFGALIAALTTGRPELAALGAPFLSLAAIGLMDRAPPVARGTVVLDATRVIEGEELAGAVTVDWDGDAEVEVMLSDWHGVAAIEPPRALAWSPAGSRGPVTLPFRLRAQSWGVHDLGVLRVRMRRPGGLLLREQKLAAAPRLWVMPAPLRLDRLLRPAEARAVAGMHVSRFRGHGTDFAELRPYQPGDRMRDVSWATSARLGKPWVTVHHSERTATVLLFLDATLGRDATGSETLARAARAAWAVASVHLSAQDRVGLLARGRNTTWLPPRGGRRARWLLLEELLGVGAAAEDRTLRRRGTARALIPPDALIVGITALQSIDFIRELLHCRRAGHTAVALVIDTADLLPGDATIIDGAARRIRLAQRDAARHSLERGGVPTALVTPGAGVGPAITSIRRRLAPVRRSTGAAAR